MGTNIPCTVKLVQENKVFRNEKGVLGEISFTLPQCQGALRKSAAKRIDGFYKTLRAHVLRDAKFRLQKEAEKEQSNEAFLPFRADVSCEISYHNGHYLSVICDRSEEKTQKPETIFRRSDIWDINTGFPVLWEDLFAKKPVKTQKILSLIQKMSAQDKYTRLGDERALRLYFDKERYYLTPDSIVFYYQPGTVAPPNQGCVLFPIPLDTLGVCLTPNPANGYPRLRRLRFLTA